MGKFIPSQHVERLEYDFTEYGGNEGVIPEPSTGRVNAFFKHMKDMTKEVQRLRGVVQGLEEVEDMSDEQLIDRMSQVEEAEAAGSEFQKRTIENLAFLCGGEFIDITDGNGKVIDTRVEGGSPDVSDFQRLPFRVLQAFSQWLMGEIRPKATTPATKR